MGNILEKILKDRKNSLAKQIKKFNEQDYNVLPKDRKPLSEKIRLNEGISIISEIKLASPSLGKLSENLDISSIAKNMENAGAVGLSILTEPQYFNGLFENLLIAQSATNLPCLMKDFVFDKSQFELAVQIGATNILLINFLGDLEKLYELAIEYNLEPLIEIHNIEEIEDLKRLTEIGLRPKLIGVNNRNLKTSNIDVNISKTIIPKLKEGFDNGIQIISESGLHTYEEIKELKSYGADAFLIGSSIMKSKDIKEKILELRGR